MIEVIPLDNLKKMVEAFSISKEELWTQISWHLINGSDFKKYINTETTKISHIEGKFTLEYKLSNGKYLFLEVDPTDFRTAGFTILTYGNYEGVLERTILDLCAQSKVFFDVGANVGFYSIGSCLLNSNLTTYSFEPNSQVVQRLSLNVNLNLLSDRIRIFNFALSNSSGVSDFFIPSFTGTSGGSFRDLHPEEGKAKRISVRTASLDNFPEVLSEPSLIKIDVEGAELEVLYGADSLIKDCRPTLVIELLRKWLKPFGNSPQLVVEYLLNLGYYCYSVGNQILKINLIDDSTEETNFVFVHNENIRHLSIIENKLT